MNIRTIRSEKNQSEEPKPKKLAIGGEDGFKPDEKLWNEETQYSIFYDGKNFELDSLPSELDYLSKVADAVINSTSAEKKMEIAAWKPDAPQVSKFAENLQQLDNGKKSENIQNSFFLKRDKKLCHIGDVKKSLFYVSWSLG